MQSYVLHLHGHQHKLAQWLIWCSFAKLRAASSWPSTQISTQTHLPSYSWARLSNFLAAAGHALHQGAKKSATSACPGALSVDKVVALLVPFASAMVKAKSGAVCPIISFARVDGAIVPQTGS